jgi:hypothetical protein
MKKIILFIAVGLFTLRCENKDISPCYQYQGKIIMTSCCTGSTFINIESSEHIGKTTTLNGQEYSNVIQVPDYMTGNNIYLNLRKFDSQKDDSLYPIHCMCFIAEFQDVPVFVATAISTTSCSPNQY